MPRALLPAALLMLGASTAAQAPQPPRFTASVEVTSIDATVVDDHGRPVEGLTTADFTVRIDGNPRRIVSAEWVRLATDPKAPTIAVPEGYSSNESASGGRLIVIAVDQPNIRFGANAAIARTAQAFIDRLAPSDRVAVTGFGQGAPVTPFTADRERLKRALARMTGQREGRQSDNHTISTAEAQAIDRGDRSTLQSVQDRECSPANFPRLNPAALELCRAEVETQAQEIARQNVHGQDATLAGLRELLTTLKTIDAPKTLILISEGFILDDPVYVTEVGALAAAARTGVYALKLERDVFSAAEARMPVDAFGDRQAMAAGLETLVGAARGAVFNISGTGAAAFERIEGELAGYYLIAVESDARDRDGKPHQVRVDVTRKGLTIRTRRQVVNAATDVKAVRTAREAVTAGLTSPLLLAALPIRVATFALQGPERAKVQLLIHADIGADYTASRSVAIGFMLLDRNGRLVDSQATDQRLAPMLNGVPSALQFTGGASVPPGDYTLKLAVADGDKAGSVEHPVHAALNETAGVVLSDLTVGGPVDRSELLRPTVSYSVSYGTVHAYLEAYGAKLDALSTTFEIAADANGPALLTAKAPNRKAGDTRSLFSQVIPVQQLPAGKYVLRAVVSDGSKPVETLTRAFEVVPPAVLMSSADGLANEKSTDAELFLPVGDDLLAKPFRREDALTPAALDPFKARVPPALRPAFETGVALITAGDYAKAEASLKKAIQPDADSTAGMAYLAVCFAAAGHDPEAASAFQTALIEGSDLPQLYDWLAGALMRTHDMNEARSVLEEATGKWPSDARFTRPLALVYATFGRGREAVRTLERYLAAQPDDADALFLGVEWIYNIHAAGGLVHTPPEDVKLAHSYAGAYEKAGGPQAALVKQWTDFLDNEKR